MKKLIALAAIATCGAALAVESANIVGYMSKDMPTAGYYNYTPMFVGVDGSNPAVKDIVPSSAETDDLSGGVIALYVLDTNRKFAKTFTWSTVDDFMDEDGWLSSLRHSLGVLWMTSWMKMDGTMVRKKRLLITSWQQVSLFRLRHPIS